MGGMYKAFPRSVVFRYTEVKFDVFLSNMRIFAKWIMNALFFLAVANIVPGIVVRDFGTALWIALLWGLIGVTLRPILLLLTLPVTLLTLGLFTFVVNGFLFLLLAKFTEGFSVNSFSTAFFGALLLSLFNWVLVKVFQKGERER